MTLFLKKEVSRNNPTRIVFVLVSASAVIFGGYILALAILAPQQLAEATAAATDLVCSGCVGTSDIADGAVTSAKIGSGQVGNSDLATDSVTSSKIGSGQVGNSDIANNAVGSAKIGSGQVGNTDIATSAVTTSKISDTNGVYSVDIVDGQVGTADIADGTIQQWDISSNAIKPNVQIVAGPELALAPSTSDGSNAVCPSGTILTGGGYVVGGGDVRVMSNYPSSVDTWRVFGFNEGSSNLALRAFALCEGPSP